MTSRHEKIKIFLEEYHRLIDMLSTQRAKEVFTQGMVDVIDSEFDRPPHTIPLPPELPSITSESSPERALIGYAFLAKTAALPRGMSGVLHTIYPTKAAASYAISRTTFSSHAVNWAPYLNLKEIYA